MPDTRSSSLIKNNDEEKKTDNPKSLLENYVQLNETVAPIQPDDSPTHIKQRVKRRSSRRSSGIRALTQTPRVLLKNFVENAPEETTVQVNSSSVESDTYLTPIPQKISKVADDDHNDSSVYEEEIVRKMPRTRYKAVLEKVYVGLKQQSESPGEDSGSETKRKPQRIKKIRNKITAEDIASGIKLSQEMAVETERSYNVTETTKISDASSLFYPSMNTLNAENIDNTTMAVEKTSPEKPDSSDTCEEKEDSHHSKPEKYSKRKRSIIKEDSSKVEETVQKAKMLRLKTNADKIVSIEDVRSPEVEKPELPKLVSEAELTEVAYTVEVAESMEVIENVQDVGSEERSENHEIEERIIVKKITNNVRQETEETENSVLSIFNEINKLFQDESINTEKTTNNKESEKANKAILYTGDIKRTNSSTIAVEDSSEQPNLKSSQSVSKTSEELPSTPGINMVTVGDSKDAHSEMVKSTLEDVEAVAKSSRDDNSDAPKGSGSKEYLTENVDSSYLEALSGTFELKENTAKEHPLLDSKVRKTGESQTSDVSLEIAERTQINLGVLSVGKVNSSIISHESSVIASQTSEISVQSNEIEEKEEQSIESPILIEEKEKHKSLGSLVTGNVSTDEHDELFPSSPKETTSSGHSRSSSPASSEAGKATQCLTLPSSKSAFVEMKSPRSNVLPSSSGVLTKKLSSLKKSSIKRKSLEQLENKSYQVIGSVANPTESVPSIEHLHVTKGGQILLSQSPFHTTISTQQTTERRHVAPQPQGATNQNEKSASQGSRKHTFRNRLKKYTIPPKVTSLLMNHYSGLKIPTACLPELGKISDQFFDNLFEALNSYAKHASHKKIEDSDVELYFKRVGLVNKDKSIKTLIREYLPREDQQLLIPVARSGNVVTGGYSNKGKQKSKRNQ